MPLQLKKKDWRDIFPRAPGPIINALHRNVDILDAAGITKSRTRLAYTLANVEHECGGFKLRNLTENINYSPERMAAVWPNRVSSAADVVAKYGRGRGWRQRAFDDIYGGRMGNRRGTSDGSTYIGRGAPQITGRGGYKAVGRIARLDLVNQPELATLAKHQSEIIAAFWTWKKLDRYADRGQFTRFVKAWNGGTNGMADRRHHLAGNDPIISRLQNVATILPSLDHLS